MKPLALSLTALLLSLASPGFADEGQNKPCCPPPPPASKEFEQLKSLAGTWQGTAVTGEETEPVTVKYELTSGGTALVEHLSPDTPHAMISVYHDKAGQPTMTHYCMLGNQPQMKLIKADATQMEFSLAEDCGIDAAREPHMHQLTITWTSPDAVTQTWTMYENGQAKMSTTLNLTRTP